MEVLTFMAIFIQLISLEENKGVHRMIYVKTALE